MKPWTHKPFIGNPQTVRCDIDLMSLRAVYGGATAAGGRVF